MGAPTFLLIPLLRLALFFGCRLTVLPWLFGEAKHASLDLTPAAPSSGGGDIPLSNRSETSLPGPVTSSLRAGSPSSSSSGPRRSSTLFKSLGMSSGGNATPTSAGNAAPPLLSLSPSSLSALLLALSFEESTLLFVLVLMEGMGDGWFDRAVLRANWGWSLVGVVGLAVCFVPMGLSILVTFPLLPQTGIPFSPRRVALSLIPFVLWMLLFLKVPLPAALSSAQASPGASTTATLLESALARTAVVGVTLIALLSGSGAMGAAMDSYQACFSHRIMGRGGRARREPTASEVATAEASFRRACEDLERTKREIDRVNALPEDLGASTAGNGSSTGPGWFSGIGKAIRGSARDRELKTLNVELSSLSMLASAMRDELDGIKARRKEAERSKTLSGRAWLLIGHAFAAYCVMRLGVSLVSLLLLRYRSTPSPSPSPTPNQSTTFSPDVISNLLARILAALGPGSSSGGLDRELIATYSKQISLLFVGVLILGRLRVVLNYLAQFFRAASAGISTSFLILFLAEVMSIYLLATLIQLRASLPPSFVYPGVDAGSGIDAGAGAGAGVAGSIGIGASAQAAAAATTAARIGRAAPSNAAAVQPPLLATLPDFNVVFGALFDSTFLLSAAGTLLTRWYFEVFSSTSGVMSGESILFGGGSDGRV